jgi:hypothetical protein
MDVILVYIAAAILIYNFIHFAFMPPRWEAIIAAAVWPLLLPVLAWAWIAD